MDQETAVFIYVTVDEEGNVTRGLGGISPLVPDYEYDFFFIRTLAVLENITKHRVVLNGFKADLVLKEGETLDSYKTLTEVEEIEGI